MKRPKIILASVSPRRLELLRKTINEFSVIPSGFNEQSVKEKDAVKFAVKAAVGKAKDVGGRNPGSIVIGADTVVALNGKIFSKPKDDGDSKRMLRALSGKTHQVITGIAVYEKEADKLITAHEVTDVTFKKLSDKEIDDYIIEGSVNDKAGSYAIQNVGKRFIKEIKGDYDNVVGLPLNKLKEMLLRIE